ncbi:MAG: ArsB/NhaD family transporter [Sandaracinus sp.]
MAIPALLIFATMMVLVVVRPRGASEAWWTVLAAALMLVLGIVSVGDALDVVRSSARVMIFLAAMLWLSHVVAKSGFFEWAAAWCAQLAGGDTRALFRNTFVLGALVTAVLSLDTTAVVLTPIVVVLVRRLDLPAAPFVLATALVSNVGSLVLPVSNLTNLLFAEAFELSFAGYTARMLVPQLVALIATYGLLRARYRRVLPASFDRSRLRDAAASIPDRAFFRASVVVLALVLAGCFLSPWTGAPPWVVASIGAGLVTIAGLRARRVEARTALEVSWGVVPFVLGLFVAIRGVERLGVVEIAGGWLAATEPGSLARIFGVAGGAALGSNLINNLPAALIARTVLTQAPSDPASVLAALVGTDVGSTVTPFGSLATMLVLTLARREGAQVSNAEAFVLGAWLTPVVLVLTALALFVAS